MTGRGQIDAERGETLLEVVVAIVILGVAAVAMAAGMAVSIKVSDIHRKQASAGAYVRDYAEGVEQAVATGGYASGTGSYPSAYTPPNGYLASQQPAKCWTGSAWTGCSAAADIGVQQLTLQVASPDNRAVEKLVVVVRKPCSQGQTTCG
jgi:prepilin-type N-terminal cleavage/methylation domain-containing protein